MKPQPDAHPRSGRPTWPSYHGACGWQAMLAPRRPRPALDGDESADLVVVGAGYTGLAVARTWARLRDADRIVVVDATTVGEGSPGRNSGFMLEIGLAADADPAAVARMTRCNALIGETMDGLRQVVSEHGIDCQLERSGTYRGARTEAGMASLASYRRFLDATGLPYESLSGRELAERTGLDGYRGGLYSPDCSLVQPAALVRGLADCLPPSVDLRENSPVLSIAREGSDRWRVLCPGGSVRAPRLVLANNAFAARLGVGASRLAVMYTYAGLTAPLGAGRLECLGRDRDWGLLPAHRLGTTLRRTADGRLLIRSHYDYEREQPAAAVVEHLRRALLRRFPDCGFEDDPAPFEFVWGGATGFTRNGSPLWGRWSDGLHVSAGCNGGGVVKGTLFGELLARSVAGEPVADVHALFGSAAWMPPDPLRRLGFVVQSTYERRQAEGEI